MSVQIAIVGAGMTAFGKHADRSLKSLGREAIEEALDDAGMEIGEIDMAFVANSMSGIVTGHAAAIGQSILRDMGMTGIPVYNIDNACAGSSSAISLAVQAIRSGAASTVLVAGVEKLIAEDRTLAFLALNGAADPDVVAASGIDVRRQSVFVAFVYPKRLAAYADRYGLEREVLAKISVKNRRHAAHNPHAQYVDPITLDDVLNSRQIVGPVTQLMCAPIGDGASAVIVTRSDRVRRGQRPVRVLASVVGMGGGGADGHSAIQRVAAKAYDEAGIGPRDIDVAEVHDSISFNELVAYEELGFCGPGEGATMVAEGVTELGGRLPVNTSGGLESRGHPVAATGTAQLYELVAQLRGAAGGRQVPGARFALAENAGGLAGDDTAAICVTLLGAWEAA